MKVLSSKMLGPHTLSKNVKSSSIPVLGKIFADTSSLELIFGVSRNKLSSTFVEMSKQLTFLNAYHGAYKRKHN